MPQQINLLTPILLTPKRYFSALALVQAAGLLVVAGLLAAPWLQHRDRQATAEHQALLGQYATERQSLLVARASLPAPQDAGALEQQLRSLEAGNADRTRLLATLGSGGDAGPQHSDLLALVARTLPDAAWLTELRVAAGRLELAGGTLDTAQLRPWLGQLAAHPLLAGQDLTALRVERLGSPGSDATLLPAAETTALQARGLPVWTFRVVSAPPPVPAAAASAGARP